MASSLFRSAALAVQRSVVYGDCWSSRTVVLCNHEIHDCSRLRDLAPGVLAMLANMARSILGVHYIPCSMLKIPRLRRSDELTSFPLRKNVLKLDCFTMLGASVNVITVCPDLRLIS